MEAAVQFVIGQPLWVLLLGAAVIITVLVVAVGAAVSRHRFRRRVQRFLTTPGARIRANYFADSELLTRSALLEKMARSGMPTLVSELGLDALWSSRLHDKGRPSDFRRLLRLAPSSGLFACFLVALKNARLADELRSYLTDNPDFFVLRALALSGKGEQFSGEAGLRFFSDRVDEIREMTGDPEWASRYFAIKILLNDDDDRSLRMLWESFRDPHPLVRRTIATEIAITDAPRLYEALMDLFLRDPVFEVRTAARERLAREFSDRYALNPGDLTGEELYHVIQLLESEDSEDQNLALDVLGGDDLELRLPAARFLVRAGVLDRLLSQADFGDEEGLDRIRKLLTNAASVHVVDFLEVIARNPAPPVLFLAAVVLAQSGSVELLTELGERVFRLQSETTPHYPRIYRATVSAIGARGAESALRLMARDVERRRSEPSLLGSLLENVPRGSDAVFAPTLMAALHDETFPAREALRKALRQMDPAMIVADSLDIIGADRGTYPHRVRVDALMLLGESDLPYALQEILEHLPILPHDEAREFALLMQTYHPQALESKVRKLLDSVDGSIRASIIAALPATGKKTFINRIRDGLQDADPDVRISAAWALVAFEDARSLSQAVTLLRDPAQRVRISVAQAIGTAGGPATLNGLQGILEDENEVEAVKLAAVSGLGVSTHVKAVDILMSTAENEESLGEPIRTALASKCEARSVSRLVEHFKEATPAIRDYISTVFKAMGSEGETAVREVLDEDIAGLKPHLAEILEETGYVESRIRLLSHRDPAVRRDAAAFLSNVGTRAAFRGIVMAARDPDQDVRVAVTKALERLDTPEGSEILKQLEEDPERRIRTYTHWAMERLRARKL